MLEKGRFTPIPRWQPTLLQVRFGRGRLEKCPATGNSLAAYLTPTEARKGGAADVAQPLRENGDIPTPLGIWFSACVR